MAIVDICEVERHPVDERLLGASIDAPVATQGSDTYSFNVRGWALGGSARVESFRIVVAGRVAAEVPPNKPRPDIAEAFADVDGAERSGFEVLVRAIELEPAFELEVVAALEGGSTCRLATIRGRRSSLSVGRDPALQPLMLTTIGRSGSKWLTWLVSCHPQIVAFQPLVFEPRVMTYWTTVFRALTEPKSYLRQIHAERWDEKRWWLGDGAAGLPAPVELGMAEWLGVDSVREIGEMCQERVEAFYAAVAQRSGREDARYFAEKCLLDPVLLDLTTEIFPNAREVILVRDFRDRLSSVFAWNRKQGQGGFGHEAEMSEAEYLAKHVRADADGLLRRRQRKGDAAHLVRYEDLIREPHATVTGLLDFLELDGGAAVVEEMLETAGRQQGLDTHRTVRDPSQTIGRWRRDLPSDLAEQCNEILAPVLAEFGYATEVEPAGAGDEKATDEGNDREPT